MQLVWFASGFYNQINGIFFNSANLWILKRKCIPFLNVCGKSLKLRLHRGLAAVLGLHHVLILMLGLLDWHH